MKKMMKVPELTGVALDWAVAQIEERGGQAYLRDGKLYDPLCEEYLCYSTDPSLAGAIVERERIALDPLRFYDAGWVARKYDDNFFRLACECGPTTLIAAMRCYVALKLGDEVDVIEVPEELL